MESAMVQYSVPPQWSFERPGQRALPMPARGPAHRGLSREGARRNLPRKRLFLWVMVRRAMSDGPGSRSDEGPTIAACLSGELEAARSAERESQSAQWQQERRPSSNRRKRASEERATRASELLFQQ